VTNNEDYYQQLRISFEVLVLRKELILIQHATNVDLFILKLYYLKKCYLYYWNQKDFMLGRLGFYSWEMY